MATLSVIALGETMSVVTDLKARKGFISVKEVAGLLGMHRQTVYQLVWDGRLPYTKVGDRLKFDPAELARWIESRSC